MKIIDIDPTEKNDERYRVLIGNDSLFFTGKELWRIVEKYLNIKKVVEFRSKS